jgi:hypothetical protein
MIGEFEEKLNQKILKIRHESEKFLIGYFLKKKNLNLEIIFVK